MRHTPAFVLDDAAAVAALIDAHPWATLVSAPEGTPLASHYAVMLDPTRDDLTVIGHVGRPDDRLHELGEHEVLLIIQGAHGYVSPGWYGDGPAVPTWNFTAAHLSGIPEILTPEENLEALDALVEHLERVLPEPALMRATEQNAEYAERISSGTLGFRLTPTRVVAKTKLSQDKPIRTVRRIVDALDRPGPYANPALAADMRRAHGIAS